MELFYHVVIVLEMLCVNLYCVTLCSKKRMGSQRTWLWFLAFSVVILPIGFYISHLFSGYGDGNGLFVLFGTLYCIPFLFVFRQPFKVTVTISCASWNYTMLVFAFCVQLSKLAPQAFFSLMVVLLQTFGYAVSLPIFIRFMKQKVRFILKNMEEETANLFFEASLLFFLSTVLINYIFVTGGSALLKTLVVLFLILIALVNYNLMYNVVFAVRNTHTLEKNIRIDSLTGLENRVSFYEECKLYLERNIPFSLFYIDLDQFKTINDSFGHIVGDAYLIHFASYLKSALNGWGTLFRISGDEFIFLYTGKHPEDFYRQMKDIKVPPVNMQVQFLGYSVGYTSYSGGEIPLDTLMRRADHQMYLQKRRKRTPGE